MTPDGAAGVGDARSTGQRSGEEPPSRKARPAQSDAVVLVLPGQLRDVAGGRSRMEVPLHGAGTVEAAFTALRRERPGLWDRIFTEQRELRPHVNVFVDGADIRWTGGLETAVSAGSEVVILPAVSGG